MNVAFYGGSFDPPHVAHVLAVAYLLSVERFVKVLVVPVFAHAFQKVLAPFEHRCRMCSLAMGWLPRVEVTPLEATLGAPSMTYRTLERLKQLHPEYQLRLVVGADVLGERHQWHAFERVTELAPPLILGRVGAEQAEAPPPVLPGISSTHVRRLLAQRRAPEVTQALQLLVPWAVLDYIEQEKLYL